MSNVTPDQSDNVTRPARDSDHSRTGYLPDALSPRRVMIVLVTCATIFSSSLTISQTYRLICLPTLTGFAIARIRSFQTGRKKLICRSILVKLSPSSKLVAWAVPIAASAISHRTPPCMVPIGLACFSVSVRSSMVAVPIPTSINLRPRSLRLPADIGNEIPQTLRRRRQQLA
jgi:hypothetical protein